MDTMIADTVILTEMARRLGTTITGVSELVKMIGIEPHRVPLNGNAKGLDPRAVRAINRALEAGREEYAACA